MRLHFSRMAGPPALWIAPSTPPPPSSDELAALTIASTSWVVRSPSTNVMAPTLPLYHSGVPADRERVTTAQPEVPYRRIGSILVERGLISDAQLAQALAEQDASGRLLGEILVSSFGVTRVDLADALAEQWQEANRNHVPGDRAVSGSGGADHLTDENDLRVLLD